MLNNPNVKAFLLTIPIPFAWVAAMLGHVDWSMFFMLYAIWQILVEIMIRMK